MTFYLLISRMREVGMPGRLSLVRTSPIEKHPAGNRKIPMIYEFRCQRCDLKLGTDLQMEGKNCNSSTCNGRFVLISAHGEEDFERPTAKPAEYPTHNTKITRKTAKSAPKSVKKPDQAQKSGKKVIRKVVGDTVQYE